MDTLTEKVRLSAGALKQIWPEAFLISRMIHTDLSWYQSITAKVNKQPRCSYELNIFYN